MQDKSNKSAAERVLNGIHLPPCPAVLMDVIKEARSANADLGKIARLISQDIGLSAPMLKLANSPYFRLRSRVSSVQQAVTVLGMKNTVNLVSNVSLRANVVPELPGLEEFWNYSSLTALIASHIAAEIPGMSRDDAYTVGLFHDCGIPVLKQKFPDYEKNVDDLVRVSGKVCEVENACYSTTNAAVGNLLARNWLLPQQMCRAILFHHDVTIFGSTDADHAEVCTWVALIHAAEYIADTHLGLRNDGWTDWQPHVLKHLQFDAQEFSELCFDVENLLRGDD